MKVDGLSVVWRQNHWDGFSGLRFKTDSYGLVILASKSPRRFLGWGLKIKKTTIYWFHHKTDGRMKTALDTHRDLAACFAWKQVGLGFLSLALRLVEVRRVWCMWYPHGGYVEVKLKTDGSIRRAVSDPVTLLCRFHCIRL
jgi:hypothetical protein